MKPIRPLPTDYASGHVVAGEFLIEEVVGRGSFSTVYRTQHLKWQGRTVALKVLHQGIQTQYKKKHGGANNPYLKEQVLCRRLNYPTFCKVLKVGETDDERFFAAMEWAHGISLEERIARDKAGLPFWVTATVLEQLGRSIAEMHIQRVIHRDIKPANLMLMETADGGVTVRVLDFGIGKLLDEDDSILRDSDLLVGTPAYMSPEQALKLKTTPRSDIYAMAAVLYEMLTGKRPIQLVRKTSESYQEYLTGSKPIPSVPLQQLRPDAPVAVAEVIQAALSRDPAKRPGSVKAFMDGTLVHLKGLDAPPEPSKDGVWNRIKTRLFGAE